MLLVLSADAELAVLLADVACQAAAMWTKFFAFTLSVPWATLDTIL
jgi:hypothetical protein